MTKLVNAADRVVHVGSESRNSTAGKRLFFRLTCQDESEVANGNLSTQQLRLSLRSDTVPAEDIAVDELFYAVDNDGPVGNGMIYAAASTLQMSQGMSYIVAYMTGLRLRDLRTLSGQSKASVEAV